MPARLLLRRVQQARAGPLVAPILEDGEGIDIPFIVLLYWLLGASVRKSCCLHHSYVPLSPFHL